MGNKHQDPNPEPSPPTPQAQLQEGETHPLCHGQTSKPTQSWVCSSLEAVLLGCQGNSLPESSQMPAGSSLAPHFPEEKVINEKVFTNNAEFPPHEQSAVWRATVHPLFIGPTSTWFTWEVNAELCCQQLSALDSPSSAPHGCQHSLLILPASTHQPCSACAENSECMMEQEPAQTPQLQLHRAQQAKGWLHRACLRVTEPQNSLG